MRHQLIELCYFSSKRRFATKYSGRVVCETKNGRAMAVTVEAPEDLLKDARGYALPRHYLICKVSRILQSPASADPFFELSECLNSLALTITTSEASEILKALKTPRKAIEFFRFCSSSIPGFRHDCFTYNRILIILAKSSAPNSIQLVRGIVDEMEQSHVRGSISTVNILIGIFGSSIEWAMELERCLGFVKKWDLRFNSYTYKCLLQAYLRFNDSSRAFEIYTEIRRHGHKLDIFAYNMLLDALAKDEKV